MAENDQIRRVHVPQPTEDLAYERAEADLVAAERTRLEAALKMKKVAEIHREHRLVGGQDR